jgi:hypothetical protein
MAVLKKIVAIRFGKFANTKVQKTRRMKLMTDSDNERMEDIMDRILARREERDFFPDRDEDKIADILNAAENKAALEHALFIEARNDFSSAVKYQVSANESDEEKEFPQFDRYRDFGLDELE